MTVVDPYVESWADHTLTAFLAACKPSRVLRDLDAGLSKVERERQRFLTQKAAVERSVLKAREVETALELAREMRQR